MMKKTRRQSLVAALSLAALAGVAAPSWAQTYPSKPITVIVPFPVGGGTDVLARLYAEKLSARIGQPVVVQNMDGDIGIVGTNHVAAAAPDGYTLLMTSNTFSIAQLVFTNSKSGRYDVLEGFTPIIQATSMPQALVVDGSTGFKSLQDVVAASQKQPLNYASSPDNGSPSHLLGEMVNKATGIQAQRFINRGTPPLKSMTEGKAQMTYATLGPVLPLASSGKVTILAVAEPQRTSLAPHVPTFRELGIKDVEATVWHAIFGPKNMPAEVVKTLNAHFNEILKMPDVTSKMTASGAVSVGGPPETLAKTSADDLQRLGPIIKSMGQ